MGEYEKANHPNIESNGISPHYLAIHQSLTLSSGFVGHLTDLACHPSHGFGGRSWVHLTDLAPGFWVLSHEFGMPFV
jgi:hypothetical protein